MPADPTRRLSDLAARLRVLDLLLEPQWQGRSHEWLAREARASVELVKLLRSEFPSVQPRLLSRPRDEWCAAHQRLLELLADPVWDGRSTNWLAQAAQVSWALADKLRTLSGRDGPAKRLSVVGYQCPKTSGRRFRA